MQIESIFEKNKNEFPDVFSSVIVEKPVNNFMPDMFHLAIPPFNTYSLSDTKNHKLQFNINSTNLLDPYSVYLEFEIENPNDNDIQFDGSAHSLIESIEIYSNGRLIEKMENYDFLSGLTHDMQITLKERKRRKKYEGFGDNQYGTNETIICMGKDKFIKENENDLSLAKKALDYSGKIMNGSTSLINDAEMGIIGSSENNLDFIKNYTNNNRIPDKDVNEWEYVKNGKIVRYPDNDDPCSNVRKFKIPFMSKIFGFGQPSYSYRLIPLEIFEMLYVVVKLNPDAFFVPMKLSKSEMFELGLKSSYISNKIKSSTGKVSNKFVVKSAALHTDQYIFERSFTNAILERIAKGEYRWNHTEMEIIDEPQMIMSNKMVFTRNLSRSNIKSIYMVWRNDLYTHSKYARKNARYNRGFSKIVFKNSGSEYPIFRSDRSYNSLSNCGEDNADLFYDQFNRANSQMNFQKTVCSYKNFCLDYDVSHIVGIYECMRYNSEILGPMLSFQTLMNSSLYRKDSPLCVIDKKHSEEYLKKDVLNNIFNSNVDYRIPFVYKKVNDYSSDFDAPTSRCIHTINFEGVPYVGNKYISGISTDLNIPIQLEFTRLNKHVLDQVDVFSKYAIPGVFWVLSIIFEQHVTLILTESGSIIKS